MKTLVINTGSSSLKFRLFDMPSEQVLCSGIAERIGEEQSSIQYTHAADGADKTRTIQQRVADHAEALRQVVSVVGGDVEMVGHRVVHGGDHFSAPTLITSAVKETIKQLFSFAPLHNAVSLRCIEVSTAFFPAAKQVAVFDTAFHHRLPPQAARYALPNTYYKNDKIRAYGFHGISHKYVTEQAMTYLQNPDARMISIHLGNGCSIAAVRGHESLDTSMGLTPVSGLVMGTRSGDIDPSVVLHLMTQSGLSAEYLDKLLNKQSGLQGITGHSDMRDVHKAAAEGDPEAQFACELYAYRIKKYIGAYVAVLNGVDALIFTAGVGEHDSVIREMVCSDLEWLQLRLDPALNALSSTELREINIKDSKTKILVIPTNEELEIARQCVTV
jgi:acetate kinase